eukprot:TRINITY_DN5970_c0_g1_i1.p1 TRINITY_DN5970_c0_g1~~TRINITY_DN5970_c0_g1_i1.p1  ORF type:complete len:157 (-),score=27.87 TRINITY_DN5970_c0_g1_i1:286-756(-)
MRSDLDVVTDATITYEELEQIENFTQFWRLSNPGHSQNNGKKLVVDFSHAFQHLCDMRASKTEIKKDDLEQKHSVAAVVDVISAGKLLKICFGDLGVLMKYGIIRENDTQILQRVWKLTNVNFQMKDLHNLRLALKEASQGTTDPWDILKRLLQKL